MPSPYDPKQFESWDHFERVASVGAVLGRESRGLPNGAQEAYLCFYYSGLRCVVWLSSVGRSGFRRSRTFDNLEGVPHVCLN